MAQPQQHQRHVLADADRTAGKTYLTNAKELRAQFEKMDPPNHIKVRFEGAFEKLEAVAAAIFIDPNEDQNSAIPREQRLFILTAMAIELMTDYIEFVPGQDEIPLYHPLDILEKTGLKGHYLLSLYVLVCDQDPRKLNLALAAFEGQKPPHKPMAPILSKRALAEAAEGLKTLDFDEIKNRLEGNPAKNPISQITDRGVQSSLRSSRQSAKRPKLG